MNGCQQKSRKTVMNILRTVGSRLKAGCFAALALGSVSQAAAPPPQAPAPPAVPRAFNAIDLTGTWVAVVTEDWRWRMVTPAKGDYTSVPLTPEARKVADAWEPSQDGSCMAYGAAGLLRLPTRVRISWESDSVLKLETDAGQQTRRLMFAGANASAARTLQGSSVARWLADLPRSAPVLGGAAGGAAAAPAANARHSTLEVATTNMSGGWLRRNGVPYSADTNMTEYFDRFPAPNGDEWMVVTTIVEDPKYLREPFVTSSHFKREPNDSKWRPTACRS